MLIFPDPSSIFIVCEAYCAYGTNDAAGFGSTYSMTGRCFFYDPKSGKSLLYDGSEHDSNKAGYI